MSQSVVWQKWIAVFKVKDAVRVQIVGVYLSGWSLLSHSTFRNETWYDVASSWPRVSCKKVGFQSSRSRSQCWLKKEEERRFFHISCTSEPFATKLDMVVHDHKLECCVTILDCCSQGQGHSEGSDIVREYLSKDYLLNHLLFLDETRYAGVSSWSGVSCEKFGFLQGQCHSLGSNPNFV